jgi:two-component system NtrC family sensor kinase
MSSDQKKFDEQQDSLKFVENIKKQWLATIDAMVDPLMIINRNYEITKCNQATAMVAREDFRAILGKKCYSAFAGRDEPCIGCKLKETFESSKPATFGLKGIRENSHYEVSTKPFNDPSGAIEGVIHVYRDRTEAKRLEEQLLQSEKLASIGLLAGGIAHEINNPLAGILIFSQMMLKEMPKDSQFYEDVVEIESATQRCKSIVERLLEFARQQPSDLRKDENEEVNVIDAVKSALRFGKVSEHARDVEIHESWQGENHLAAGNRNKLIQVFLNLFQNAFQSMPGGGDLTVRAWSSPETDSTIIEVEDSGIGISPSHLKRVFDPFFTTKDPGEGTGLGLAICYGIIQDMNGTLTVASQVNEGTTFKISLPIFKPTKG